MRSVAQPLTVTFAMTHAGGSPKWEILMWVESTSRRFNAGDAV